MLSNTDEDELHEIFPLHCNCFETRGLEEGMILRFKTFYLKIYDDEYNDSYNVQGFLYNDPAPVFEKSVEFNKLREFASLFTEEDYLEKFRSPCFDPRCCIE